MPSMLENISDGSETKWPDEVVIFTDGACRGNPGPSSIAFYVTDQSGDVVYQFAEAIGTTTNNVAEYKAVVSAFAAAGKAKAQTVHLRSDSQLLIRQLLGEYKVKAPNIIPLHQECLKLKRAFKKATYTHVRREENVEADALANKVLDLNGL